MRIVYITNSLKVGGSERQLVHWINLLSSEHEILVISTFPYTKDQEYYLNMMGTNFDIKFMNRANIIKSIFDLLILLKKFKPDIIQSIHNHINFPVSVLSFLFKAKSIASIRSNGILELDTNRKFRSKLGFLFSDLIIGNNFEGIDYVEKKLNISKSKYLRNYVNVNDNEIFMKEDSLIRFLFVGRLIKLKCVDLIIKAIINLKEQEGLDIRFDIVGDGDQRIELEELSQGYPYINFYGTQDPNVFYRKSDVFILFSNKEGTPNVILEAQSFGLPIITRDVGEIKNVIVDEHSIILKNNAGLIELEDSIREFSRINNEEIIEIKEEILKEMKKTFNPIKFKLEIEKIYEKLINS